MRHGKSAERQVARIARRQAESSKPKRFTIIVSLVSLLAIVLVALAAWPAKKAPSAGSQTVPAARLSKQPKTLQELLALSPAELANVDLALANMLCAEGLPGAEDLNLQSQLDTLDHWAQHVKSETDRNFHRLRDDSANANSSEGDFRAAMLITVLQQDFNVRYNPAHMASPDSPEPDNAFFADSKDLFLHGIASRRAMGTCVSMPVFYVAVGRRLGYPMKLVTAKAHLFARWESADGKERFNIEGTNQGLSTPDDEYYTKWPYPMTEAELKSGQYLKSLTTAEELAIFLETRGHCLRVAGRFGEAQAAYLQARALAPQWPEHEMFLAALNEERLRHRSFPRRN